MRICFVQPNNSYQVLSNKIAFSLTFPQIICNLNLEQNYYVYIEGRNKQSFDLFLLKNSITHVFISSITSSYPRAVILANIAKELGCITVLGGLFASLNSNVIANIHNCFDYIIVGGINKSILSKIHNKPQKTTIFHFPRFDNFDIPLNPIMMSDTFTEIFKKNDVVCYELGCGCIYNCSFCTLRKAFGSQYRARTQKVIQEDLNALSKVWKRLKLIDDDIYQSAEILSKLDLSSFKEIIIETRPNHLTEDFILLCRNKGITHIITGIESFSPLSLSSLNKDSSSDLIYTIKKAVELCNKYSITLRPVIMLTSPNSKIDDYKLLLWITKDWQPKNNVEMLISMFTPHPGIPCPKGEFLTNDLSLFDHLHLVFMPTSMQNTAPSTVLQYYDELVTQTKSNKFNPPIDIKKDMIEEYVPFFERKYDSIHSIDPNHQQHII